MALDMICLTFLFFLVLFPIRVIGKTHGKQSLQNATPLSDDLLCTVDPDKKGKKPTQTIENSTHYSTIIHIQGS